MLAETEEAKPEKSQKDVVLEEVKEEHQERCKTEEEQSIQSGACVDPESLQKEPNGEEHKPEEGSKWDTPPEEAPEPMEAEEIQVEKEVVPQSEEITTSIRYPLVQPNSVIELSRRSWPNAGSDQHYTRGCMWSPDGTCVLTAVNLDGMHVIELPRDIYNSENINQSRPVDILSTSVYVKEGGTVYDYCWYPHMNSNSAETCCWLASRQHEPIQMWDAYDGQLRATYRGYNSADEVQSAYSICFSPDGEEIIAGYKKAVRIFRTKRPGRDYTELGVKEACSVIAVSPVHEDLFITGSWNSLINLYDKRSLSLGSLSTLEGHSAGVTYIKFNPDGSFLFSGARKDNQLIQWDMRDFSKPLRIFERNVETSQRVYFDVSSDSNWLTSGDTSGLVHVWNLNDPDNEYQFTLHNDCCNGVGFHPYLPVLCSTSGQYQFIPEHDENVVEICKNYENSFIFWWLDSC